jgi:hypothetical protein
MDGFLSEFEEEIRDVFSERSNHEERGCPVNPKLNYPRLEGEGFENPGRLNSTQNPLPLQRWGRVRVGVD